MLANLKKIFNPAAVAQALQPMPPLKSTVMDTFFTNRPAHPMAVIGLSELHRVIETVPVVRRDGAPVALGGEDFETQFFAPLPIKVKIAVTASELNDLRVIMNDATAVAAWRSAKLEQIRRTIRLTTEALLLHGAYHGQPYMAQAARRRSEGNIQHRLRRSADTYPGH